MSNRLLQNNFNYNTLEPICSSAINLTEKSINEENTISVA